MTKKRRKSSGAKRRKSAGKQRSTGKRRASRSRRKSTSYWNLQITYPMKYFSRLDDVIEKILGRTSDGSGAGFGERDMSFTYATKAQVDRAYDKLHRQERLMVLPQDIHITTRQYK